MLVAKLVVPITRKIHTDIVKFASRNSKCNNGTQCSKTRNVIKEEALPKCKEYQEKHTKCPKSNYENLCCEKLFSKSTSKCATKSAIDNYQKTYEDVTSRANSILQDIQNKSKSVIDQLVRDIEVLNNNEQTQLQGFLHDIKKTLQKLLALDPSCGSLKRKCAMTLSHQVHSAIDDTERDIIPQIKRIKEITENLERDILHNVDRAKALVVSCKKCQNAEALDKCVEENAIYAEKILDKTSKCASAGLDKIEALQREILQHHKVVITEISRTYRRESEEFLRHLNNCISAARDEKKR